MVNPSQTTVRRSRIAEAFANAKHHLLSFGITALLDEKNSKPIGWCEQALIEREAMPQALLNLAVCSEAS